MRCHCQLGQVKYTSFIISAATAVGALPLAVLMTSGEDVSTMTESFRILKTILPPDAFFRRGPQLGPMGIMTDDSASERQSLRATWPQATLFLCSFHFLQSTWQWLWNSTSEVDRNDRLLFIEYGQRPIVCQDFRAALCCQELN